MADVLRRVRTCDSVRFDFSSQSTRLPSVVLMRMTSSTLAGASAPRAFITANAMHLTLPGLSLDSSSCRWQCQADRKGRARSTVTCRSLHCGTVQPRRLPPDTRHTRQPVHMQECSDILLGCSRIGSHLERARRRASSSFAIFRGLQRRGVQCSIALEGTRACCCT
jgi:hypothetical protein